MQLRRENGTHTYQSEDGTRWVCVRVDDGYTLERRAPGEPKAVDWFPTLAAARSFVSASESRSAAAST